MDKDFEEEDKYFLEIYIEGVLSANKEELKALEKKINLIVSKLIKESNCVKFNTSISKYSEAELFMSLGNVYSDVEN